ncbi:YigZ family protein [Aliivibrio sp. S4TY2]|uniref:YigZ family protein n=1 Tax=unclassified Aliivibrio TaxID=2645654 RepID=UPI00237832F6|nr:MULTISPECIES: YigZ family protein [unclassified Aliivibrio]MDD9156125.1 YigZ family protein [Aliivibrio sp. S4TY2]MDD9159834.1 YigZ family protein [Aliivibrio sp. S4TY1]MDD9163833.1 YigZ family protein [Aliivibrio sp. S4MY2]MDD9167834.1 YigZ family protein [Aliivibrio sp. S4MY4]MDD9186870.1 YigZ family protein [Aliivibrio sp. S4MY3]
MNDQPYQVPKAMAVFEEEIKKSVFITYLARTSSIDEAKAFVAEIKTKHSDARHNCWGFVAGRPEDSMKWGFSDDGEPSGTAGKPILAQLSGSGIGEITAVVTRYSGGIKLGTGGLVKAYGGGVQQALKLIETEEKRITETLVFHCDYNLVSLVETLLLQFEGQQVMADYSDKVIMTVELEKRVINEFKTAVINKSGAKIEFPSQE